MEIIALFEAYNFKLVEDSLSWHLWFVIVAVLFDITVVD